MAKDRMTGFTVHAAPPTPPPSNHSLRGRQAIGSKGSTSEFLQSEPESDLEWLDENHSKPGLQDLTVPIKLSEDRTVDWSSRSVQASPSHKTASSISRRMSTRDAARLTMDSPRKVSKCKGPSMLFRQYGPRVSRFSRYVGMERPKQQKRASTPDTSTQWLDVEEGLIDRKRLSTYLGNVLGSSFQTPSLSRVLDIETTPIPADDVLQTPHKPRIFNRKTASLRKISTPSSQEACFSEEDLCNSKPAVERSIFERWPVFRRRQPKSRSTACQMHMPRALSKSSRISPRTPSPRELALSPTPRSSLNERIQKDRRLGSSVLMSSHIDEDALTPQTPIQQQGTRVRDFDSTVRAKHLGHSDCFDAPLLRFPSQSLQNDLSICHLRQRENIGNSSFPGGGAEFEQRDKRQFQQCPTVSHRGVSTNVIGCQPERAQKTKDERRLSSEPLSLGHLTCITIARVARCVPSKPTLVTHKKIDLPVGTAERTIVSKLDGRVESYTRSATKHTLPERHRCQPLQPTPARRERRHGCYLGHSHYSSNLGQATKTSA